MTQYRTLPESCFAYGTRGQNPIRRMNHRVIWSFGTLAKFIRHRTTAIRQLTFEFRDRPYYSCGLLLGYLEITLLVSTHQTHKNLAAHQYLFMSGLWLCRRRDSNPHASRR